MMRIFLSIFLVLVLAGCAAQREETSVKFYTFEVERVDQDLTGNRGYIMGTPPPAEDLEGRTRTFIGVDVELPSLGSEPLVRDRDYVPEPEKERMLPPDRDPERTLRSEPAVRVDIPEPEVVEEPAPAEEDVLPPGADEEYWIK